MRMNSSSASYLAVFWFRANQAYAGNSNLFTSQAGWHIYDLNLAATGGGSQVEMLFDFFPTPPRRLSANATLTAKATSSSSHIETNIGRANRLSTAPGRASQRRSR